MNRGQTRADANKAIRQNALRDQLSNQQHVRKLIDLIEKVEDLKGVELEPTEVQRLKIAMDNRRYLIDKYLPTIKPVEYTIGDDGANTVEDHARAIGELVSFPTGGAKVPAGKNL